MIKISNTPERLSQVKEQIEEFATMVGVLNKPTGIKGFEKCEVGHPVFELNDRYVLFMKSETELRERMFDASIGGDRTYIGHFMAAVPYYKETLAPMIDFVIEPSFI